MLRSFRFATVLLVSATAIAQQSDSTSPTFATTARMVYVDVIVRDSAGHIVRNLTQQDFPLLEDGKLKRSSSLTHAFKALPSPISAPEPAPNLEFSNIAPEASPGALTILLFDLLNTPASDQLATREQMLTFLQVLPSGQRFSLFVLTNHLQMIQSFAGRPELLTAAAKMLKPIDLQPSPEAAKRNKDTADEFAKESRSGHDPELPTAMQRSVPTQDSDLDVRTPLTISALSELAAIGAGIKAAKICSGFQKAFPSH